jgi:hypothetical protein
MSAPPLRSGAFRGSRGCAAGAADPADAADAVEPVDEALEGGSLHALRSTAARQTEAARAFMRVRASRGGSYNLLR